MGSTIRQPFHTGRLGGGVVLGMGFVPVNYLREFDLSTLEKKKSPNEELCKATFDTPASRQIFNIKAPYYRGLIMKGDTTFKSKFKVS